MSHYLIIRLSAIGDVAMTIPVVYSAAYLNPDAHFTVLTQAFLMPLFRNKPKNMEVIGIYTKTTEKSLAGLLRFTSALLRDDYDAVLDLHDVLRTVVIRNMFRLKGKPVYVVDKARMERRRLLNKKNVRKRPLRPVIERYADVFRKARLAYQETFCSLYEQIPPDTAFFKELGGQDKTIWLGIAPFAKHRGKIYPLSQMEQVVAALSARDNTHLFLFGGRGEEEQLLKQWAMKYPNTDCIAGRFTLDQELALISRLSLLICMDSANMHFASLVNTLTLSIWGATHPYAGFYGYHQPMEYAVQLPMPCRPCSIYGNRPCYRGDWACLTGIAPDTIIHKVNSILISKEL